MERTVKAVGYTRVSSAEQAAEGVSLDQQAAKIKAYCTVRDWELQHTIRDAGVSAADLEGRPGMMDLLEMIRRKEVGAVVVWKLDRLTRSVKDLALLLEMLQRSQVELASVTEHFDTSNAVGRLTLHLLTSVAEWERSQVSERTKASLHHLRATMRPYGREAFGFRTEGRRLVPFPKELKVVKKIYYWRHKVGLSLNAIAQRLTKDKVATKTGDGSWYPSTVRYILKNRALYKPHVQEDGLENRVRAGIAAKAGVKRP